MATLLFPAVQVRKMRARNKGTGQSHIASESQSESGAQNPWLRSPCSEPACLCDTTTCPDACTWRLSLHSTSSGLSPSSFSNSHFHHPISGGTFSVQPTCYIQAAAFPAVPHAAHSVVMLALSLVDVPLVSSESRRT